MNSELMLRGVCLAEEFRSDLGDPRRTQRLQRVAEAMARKPEFSLPELMKDPSELEGAYRLLRNPWVTLPGVTAAHMEASAQRCDAVGEVLIVHDTTEFAFPVLDGRIRRNLNPISKSRQGFYAHVSIAVSADGLRAPLGLMDCFPYVHHKQVDEETKLFWETFGTYESEGARWVRNIKATEAKLTEPTRAIHVCDREADRNDVLRVLKGEELGFVIRAYQARTAVDGRKIGEIARDGDVVARRTIELSERPVRDTAPKSKKAFPPRKRRQANVALRANSAAFEVGLDCPVVLNIVEVLEENPPSDEKAVHWILLTSEPVESGQDILRVVDIYRSRWIIEEFFKAIKTGCGYSKRQLDSASTLLVALGITVVLAWQLLTLRHFSRHEVDLPASVALTPLQLRILRASTPKLKWPDNPTVSDVIRGISWHGGHHRSNGPPGWQVLGRGLHELLKMVEGARLALDLDL